MLAMTRRATEMQLSIDIGSEPISGSVAMGDGAAREFCGWIELVATIESAREADSGGQNSGVGPWGEERPRLVS
jgi:hypothetical protein